MAFVLYDEDPLYYHPVNAEQPDAEGNISPAVFHAGFRNIEQPRIKEIMQAIVDKHNELQSGNVSDEGLNDETLADEVLAGWRDMFTPDGEEIPYSITNKERLLRKRGIASAIVAAWMDSILKQQEDRSGN